jgi:protein PhnA
VSLSASTGRRSATLGNVNETLPQCPECAADLTYEMGDLLVCPMCAHEWADVPAVEEAEAGAAVIKDAFGAVLANGDSITIIKDLKIKGGSNVIKVGTKVRGIRLVQGVGDHDIECRIEGVSMQLKSSVVKKA